MAGTSLDKPGHDGEGREAAPTVSFRGLASDYVMAKLTASMVIEPP
jgi:hypothetical protein